MKNTSYTIKKEGTIFIVFKDKIIETKGFTDIGSALHSIWVVEGKVAKDWYYEKEGAVVKGAKVQEDDSK